LYEFGCDGPAVRRHNPPALQSSRLATLGRFAREIANAFKNIFEHVTIEVGGEIDPYFVPGDTIGTVTVSD
jgi:hypothetical protein